MNRPSQDDRAVVNALVTAKLESAAVADRDRYLTRRDPACCS